MIGVITGLGRLRVLFRTLVRPISEMMQDFGDFARLGGFQNIKLYFLVLGRKPFQCSVGGIIFSVFSCSSEK